MGASDITLPMDSEKSAVHDIEVFENLGHAPPAGGRPADEVFIAQAQEGLHVIAYHFLPCRASRKAGPFIE